MLYPLYYVSEAWHYSQTSEQSAVVTTKNMHLIIHRLENSGSKKISVFSILIIIGLFVISHFNLVDAQELEPRAYNNTPVGMNFFLVGYQYSDGALVFDPAIPVTNANAKVNAEFLGYVRSVGIAGKSAKVGLLLPYADLSATGYVNNVYRTRDTAGMADPAFFLSINLSGAPALSQPEFRGYKQDTIIGFTLKVSAPLGQYENNKIINLGTNRWSIKPELGISKSVGRWSFDVAIASIFYTDNDDFDSGKTRKQDPIYSAQANVIYSFANKVWASIGTTYYEGGRTSIDGIVRNDLQRNWRNGFTVAIPVNRNNSFKVFGSSGVSTRTGTDYDSFGIAWQYRWGGGI